MSLAPREQERLTAIENQIRASDPRFAAMFRLLDNASRRGHRRPLVFLSVRLARRGIANVIILVATVVTLIGTGAAAVAILA